MVVREDLVVSAVSFLQDPSVASAPLDKRIAFLQSKNLTQEEIDASLARVGEDASALSTSAPPTTASSSYAYRQPPPPPAGYGGYPPNYWQQPPLPPELPKRDWRDWFIMATVVGGVSYGLYFTAKRYLLPLVAPPTPPQLEQDKAAIDESFTRAFELLDQVVADTDALKKSEESRTQRLDTALSELESVLGALKESDRRRDDDSRRTTDEVRSLRDLIPKSLDAQKESTESRLKDLGSELKSLKTLLGNRVGTAAPRAADVVRTTGTVPISGANMFGAQGAVAVSGSAGGMASPVQQPSSTTAAASGAAASGASTGGSNMDGIDGQAGQSNGSSAGAPDRALSSSPYGRMMNGRAAIPAWQMAAAKRNQGTETASAAEKKDTSDSGTVSEATA